MMAQSPAVWLSRNTLFGSSDESIIDWTALRDVKDGVPAAFLLPLLQYESDAQIRAELSKLAAGGPADAREGGECSAAQRAVAEGYAAMPLIPASHLEQLDPSRPMMQKLAELDEYARSSGG
eukprot:gene7547-12512_t